jgi:acyl-CoA synthetase (NDP forming)
VYRAIESAVAALRALGDDTRVRTPVPAVPPAADPVGGTGYAEARAALAAAGVPFGAAQSAVTADEAVAAADELGYPVVLKAVGAVHKSDAGGVVLALRDRASVAAAVERLAAARYSVEREEDTAAGLELLAGARWDRRFGPIVVVGAGGVHAELLRDTAAALAPVHAEAAEDLLRSLRGATILTGARGRPPLDLAAAAEAIAALSRFAAEHPELAEVEVNPLLVRERGAVGLDARFVPR